MLPGREQLTNDGQTSTFYDPIYKLPPFVKKHKGVYETPNLACLLGPTPSCTRGSDVSSVYLYFNHLRSNLNRNATQAKEMSCMTSSVSYNYN